jgi:mRNA interferase RelE/StbE
MLSAHSTSKHKQDSCFSALRYEVTLKPKAIKDLQRLPPDAQARILEKVELMQDDLQGDVKRLTNFTPEYRLRVGDYRILFEIEAEEIVIYRIKHRSQAYS